MTVFLVKSKKSGNAILAANAYDIRNSSLDISAYLEASPEQSKPIVIQSSFNAIGQKESIKINYLKDI